MAILDQILDIVFGHSYQLSPGFIIENFGNRLARNVFFHEDAFVGIENKVEKKFGDEFTYSCGKNFGYNYANLIDLPIFNQITRQAQFNSLMKFFETTYAKGTKYSTDWKKPSFEIHGTDIIVCRKNGSANLLFIGPVAGVLGYLCKDPEIDGKQVTCTGNGDSECFGLFEKLGKTKVELKKFDQNYQVFNKVIPFSQEYGIELMAKIGMVKRKTDTFDILGSRFFPFEISMMYNLEVEIQKSDGNLDELVYAPTFEVFETFAKNNLKSKYKTYFDAVDFTSKFFSALGWGIIQPNPSKAGFLVRGHPWTNELHKLKVSKYFTASIDGIMSGLLDKKISSNVNSIATTDGKYNISLELSKN
ncbi:hypothetical protein HY994_05350 [Candidatus Micrarchaeota archaeon]|nr:hypothetical protein [Candidatus Micrarchaeota archaeon]